MGKQRERGRILTIAGKEKLQQAIRAWELEHETRCTQEKLHELTGFDPKTISKIRNAKGEADRSKIEDLFGAFGLQLEEADLRSTLASPESNPNFVGRDDAIADLNTLIGRGAKLIVIQARGGVGKTTLAWEYFKTQGFDRVLELWMAKETQNIASVEGVLEEWLRRYFDEEPGREFGVTLERLRQKLRDPSQRIGVLIDNLEPALDQAGKFVEPHRRYVELLRVLSDPAVQSVTLMTSRERLQEADFGVEHYLLRSLDQQAWHQFFEHHEIQHDETALTGLHRAYGGNAKAMEILRSVVQADFGGSLAEYWQANQDDLFVERALEDLVVQQFDRLQQQDLNAYNLLCRMGCYRFQDVPTVPLEGLLCLLWDVPENRRRRVVRSLMERSLTEFESHMFWLHPVIRSEAIIRLKASKNWQATNREAAKFWTKSVDVIHTISNALQVFEAYHHYVELGDFKQAGEVLTQIRLLYTNKFTVRLFRIFIRFGLVNQLISFATLIINNIDTESNDIDSKYYRAKLYNILGFPYRSSGKVHQAISCYKAALQLVEDCLKIYSNAVDTSDLQALRLNSLVSIGMCKIELWELEEALDVFTSISKNHNVTSCRGETLEYSYRDEPLEYTIDVGLAFLYSCLHSKEQASEFASQVYEKLQNDTNLGRSYRLTLLGIAYKNLGKNDQALSIYLEAISHAEEFYYSEIKARAFSCIAELYAENGEFEMALEKHLEAIETFRKIGAKRDLAQAYYRLALTYKIMGSIGRSDSSFQEAIHLFTEMKAPKQVERVRRSMEN